MTAVNRKQMKYFNKFTSQIKELPYDKLCQLVFVAMDGATITISLMPDQRSFRPRKGKEPHDWQFQEL